MYNVVCIMRALYSTVLMTYSMMYNAVGVCDYQNMWYHDFADYCLESITINRLIGGLDNSAANKTILLLQVLKVMLMPSADYQFNRSLQCASKIASASDLLYVAVVLDYSTFQTKSEELLHIARRFLQGKKIFRLKEVPVALSHSETIPKHRRGLSH